MTHAPRLYVDHANVDTVSRFLRCGIVHGVTTNPSILERGERRADEIPELYRRWEAEGARELFFQTWGSDTASLLRNAEGIRALGDLAVVKVPATREGFAAAATLVSDGASVLVTAVYSVAQALMAASLGVRYIAPYLGRLNDAGFDGEALIAQMQMVCEGSQTDVLAASLRAPSDITALRLLGISYFTAAPEVIEAMLAHELSDRSAGEFEAAMARLGG